MDKVIVTVVLGATAGADHHCSGDAVPSMLKVHYDLVIPRHLSISCLSLSVTNSQTRVSLWIDN